MRYIAAMLLLLSFFSPAASQTTKERQEAPGFELKGLGNNTVRLSDYRGKVVLVNFWATWCPPCKAEMPELVKWQSQHQDKGLQIIGVTYPPYKITTVRQLARRLKINYPVVFDNKKIAQSYAAGDVLPVTIIIDRQGRIVDRILGIIEPIEFEQKVVPLLQ